MRAATERPQIMVISGLGDRSFLSHTRTELPTLMFQMSVFRFILVVQSGKLEIGQHSRSSLPLKTPATSISASIHRHFFHRASDAKDHSMVATRSFMI